MPTISAFYGISIVMHWDDHRPPHFHAMYSATEALVDIRTLAVVKGALPRRALALTLEWAAAHRDALMENWELCETKQPLRRIPPLA